MNLTVEDITDEGIHAMEVQLEQQTRKVAELQEKISHLEEQLAVAEEKRVHISNAVLWRRLMAEVEADERISGITTSMNAAIAEFRKSLNPPPDYDEGREGIPFADSDDYADFSPVESLMDDILEAILQLVIGDGGGVVKEDMRACDRRRALLMLLVLTVNFGRLVRIPEIEVAEETEELQEGLTAMWQRLLYTDAGLSHVEKNEWKHVVTTFLGEPYDTPA